MATNFSLLRSFRKTKRINLLIQRTRNDFIVRQQENQSSVKCPSSVRRVTPTPIWRLGNKTVEEQMATWSQAWIFVCVCVCGGGTSGLSSRKLINVLRWKKKKGRTNSLRFLFHFGNLWCVHLWQGVPLRHCSATASPDLTTPDTRATTDQQNQICQKNNMKKSLGSSAFWRCCCCQWHHSLLTQYATCTWARLDGRNG